MPRLRCALAAAILAAAVPAWAQGSDEEDAPWAEAEVVLPDFPQEQRLIAFALLDAPAANRFAVDAGSITVAADGVVRFALVVTTPGGARNVTYEGLRCETKERKLYASGRPDGSWSRARAPGWQPIERHGPNRYHAALFWKYLCPNRHAVRTPQEGIDALRQGGHPAVRYEDIH